MGSKATTWDRVVFSPIETKFQSDPGTRRGRDTLGSESRIAEVRRGEESMLRLEESTMLDQFLVE